MKEVRRSDLRCFFLANFCDDDGGDDGDEDGDGGDVSVSTTEWVWFVGSFHVN